MFSNEVAVQAMVKCARCSRKAASWLVLVPDSIDSDSGICGELHPPTDWTVVGRYRVHGEREIVCPVCTREGPQ